jgi:tetratricopeptide (TPR) repeat protein
MITKGKKERAIMSYKHDSSSNRDALFGSAGGGGSKKKKSSKTSEVDREDLFGSTKKSTKSSSSSSRPTTSSSSSSSNPTPSSISRSSQPTTTAPSKGYQYTAKVKKSPIMIGLTGPAKEAKLKEAEDYRDKAKKAMQKGLFSKADPLAASTYYKRAADAYQQCGESRLERGYRINSADCQMMVGAYSTAASEYTRAAELIQEATDEDVEMKREIGRKLLLNAAEAWMQMNEPGKAASSKVSAALALTWGDDSSALPRAALAALEESVEAHVPDPLNPYARYRQTGVSAYVDPNSEDETVENPSAESMALAEQHIVSRPYAHEAVQEVVYLFIAFGEYPSALHAQGAVSTLLERDGVSTLSLSRSFVAETILSLAMGDSVAAEEQFLNRHVQKTAYLSSRECKLGEELFRAIKTRDGDALEEARSTKSSNKSAIGNLHESLRDVLTMIRLSGVARRGAPPEKSGSSSSGKKLSSSSSNKKSSSSSSSKRSSRDDRQAVGSQSSTTKSSELPTLAELSTMKTGYEDDVDAADALDSNALQSELDALDFGGLDDDDESDLDDDDLDLR